MKTRRSFLKSLVGIVASLALAQRAVIESLSVEQSAGEDPIPAMKLNPAWVDAPYEVVYFHSEAFKEFAAPSPNDGEAEVRFAFVDGEFSPVPKFLA